MTFQQGRDELLESELNGGALPLWDPPRYPREHGRPEDHDLWTDMVDAVQFKKEALGVSLNRELCRVENCARFMRMNGP